MDVYCLAAYGSFHDYISARTELPFFFNVRIMRNAMDRAWMNLAISTFEQFAVQGENRSVYTALDLKNIDTQDFKILLDNMSVGTQVRWDDFEERIEWEGVEYDHVGSNMID